jgi:hypothetical protein
MGRVPPHADAVEALLRGDDEPCTCGIVVAEVFQGLRKDATRATIERSFRDMSFLEPTGWTPTTGPQRSTARCASEA